MSHIFSKYVLNVIGFQVQLLNVIYIESIEWWYPLMIYIIISPLFEGKCWVNKLFNDGKNIKKGKGLCGIK